MKIQTHQPSGVVRRRALPKNGEEQLPQLRDPKGGQVTRVLPAAADPSDRPPAALGKAELLLLVLLLAERRRRLQRLQQLELQLHGRGGLGRRALVGCLVEGRGQEKGWAPAVVACGRLCHPQSSLLGWTAVLLRLVTRVTSRNSPRAESAGRPLACEL
jgi:hypothetical protein